MRVGWLVAGWALGSAVRRLSRRTGVSDAEAFGTLPGDEVITHPMVEWTRGVTVHAPPERIWPWLVQMGYGRAGWYTPEWVDRILEPTLFQLKTPSPTSPDRLMPQFQSLAVGDLIADGPDYRSYWQVLTVAPQRGIAYRSVRHPWRPHPFDPRDPGAVDRVEQELIAGGVYLDCTWTFVLQPVGAERTRLLIRTRGNYAPGCSGRSCRRWGCTTRPTAWRSYEPSPAGPKRPTPPPGSMRLEGGRQPASEVPQRGGLRVHPGSGLRGTHVPTVPTSSVWLLWGVGYFGAEDGDLRL